MRRNVRGRARGAAVAASVVAVLAVGGCAEDGGGLPEPLRADAEFVGVAADARNLGGMARASVRLATDLLDVAGAADGEVISPLSLQLALALLREGASGTVAQEIDAVAGLDASQSVADLRALLGEFEGDVAGIDPDDPPTTPVLHIADSAFTQDGFEVDPEFLERVAAYHGADVYTIDFGEEDAQRALGAWVARETGGLLTESPVQVDADTRIVLMDTVTFGATWANRFSADDTFDEAFTRRDGSQVEVPFMHQSLVAPAVVTDEWIAVELAYTDGFAMRLVLPEAGTLTAEGWTRVHDALAAAERQDVDLSLPTWTTDTTVALTESLPVLGLGSLLDPDGGLDGVFPSAVVSAAAQAATITVAEKGTVAAAVTAFATETAAAPPVPALEVRFDRPFEYQVVHEGTGLVMFAGRIGDPSA